MKQQSYVRPLILGLFLAVTSAGVLASGKHQNAGQGCQNSGDNKQHSMQNQSKGMMQLPAELIESLKLSETQANALLTAQTAANGMRAGMRQGMRESHQRSSAQMADGDSIRASCLSSKINGWQRVKVNAEPFKPNG